MAAMEAKGIANNEIKIPCSIEAEQAVIGGILLINSAFDTIVDKLTDSDFYQIEHKILFSVIVKLASEKKPFDLLTIVDELKSEDLLDKAGGEAYLYEMAARVPSAANIAAYAGIVKKKSMQRKLINICSGAIDSIYKNRSFAELIEETVGKISEIDIDTEDNLISHEKMARENYHKLSSGEVDNLLKIGFVDFDFKISGIKDSDLVILGARPSMGKTSLALNIAENIALEQEKQVLIYSMEMTSEEINKRITYSLARINSRKVVENTLNAEEWESLSQAVLKSKKMKIYTDDTSVMTPAQLIAKTKRYTALYGKFSLIIIDYLQLLNEPKYKSNKILEIGSITRALKTLARDIKTPILALSQLSRSLESRASKIPGLSDLRESGEIEQHADIVFFIYRDDYYNPGTLKKGIAELIIAKNRNGGIGNVDLTFLPEFTRFENLFKKY